MFGHQFYHGLIRKYTALFGTLFNDIIIDRNDENNKKVQTFKVPISYAPREKWLARVENDPAFTKQMSQQLPLMSYQITGVDYDGTRKLVTVNKFISKTQIDKKIAYDKVYVPVPVNINFRLLIVGKTASDVHKIYEQIRPFFTPTWNVTAELIENTPPMDIPIELKSNSYDEDYEDDFDKRRTCIWTLDFVMRAQIYGPKTSAKIIKIAEVNLIAEDANHRGVTATVTTYPGLTADGKPTSRPEDSIPVYKIEETDDYGYIIEIEEKV